MKSYFNLALKPVIEKDFTFSYYEDFLKKISDTNKYQVVPLKNFHKIKSNNKIIISLRHDVDIDLRGALTMAKIEHEYQLSATYFLLHTANYYGITKKGYVKHNKKMIPILQKLQNEYGHEIGWHNDLVTLEIVYGIDPKKYLKDELKWLRSNKINIVGTAAHGSEYCYKFKYQNIYFFKEFSDKEVDGFPNNETVMINHKKHYITKASLKDFDLEYEAYHLDNNFYFSDCAFIGNNGKRWHTKYLNLEELNPGDKVIILTHPIHWGHSIWHKYLNMAYYFLNKRLPI